MPDGLHPEASFPSSHTMLVCVIMGSAVMLLKRYIPNKILRRTLWTIAAAMIGITVIGRLISGVHWFTDILGGLLISTVLLSLFSLMIESISNRQISSGQETDESGC